MQSTPKNNNLFCPSFNAKRVINKGTLITKKFINKIDSICSNIEKFGSEYISLEQECNVPLNLIIPISYRPLP